MAKKRTLKETRIDELERELARLKTKINMVRYFAYKQFHFHQLGVPQTSYDHHAVDIWGLVTEKLEAIK